MERKLITLYKTRTFGQKMSDTFDFVTENWKPLLKFSTYLLLPLTMVLAVCMTSMMDGYSLVLNSNGTLGNNELSEVLISYVGTLIMSMVCGLVGTALVYACMRLYGERDERLQGLTGATLKPLLLSNLKRLLALTGIGLAVSAVLIAVLFVLALQLRTASVMMMVLIFIIAPIVLVPLSLTAPVYLFEDETSALGAFAKAWRLGFATWGGTLAVLFVLGMIAYLASGALSIPYIIINVMKMMTKTGELSAANGDAGIFTSMLEYLLCVFTYFTSQLTMMLTYIGLGYQYGHASDKIEGTGTNREIEQFETL